MGKGFSQWWEERTPPGGPGRSPGTAPSVGSPFQVGLLDARRAGSLGHRSGASPARAAVSPGTAGRARRGRRAKGQRRPGRPRAAGAVGGRTRAEGEGSHLGEVPGWSQPPGAERFSCPPRLSPADPERSFPEKNAPRAAGPRSRPEPPRGKGAAPCQAGPGVHLVGEGVTGWDVAAASRGAEGRDPPTRARGGGRGGGRPGALEAALPAERLQGCTDRGAARDPDRISPRSPRDAPAPPLQPQAPPRAGDFGACGSQNLASPSELPGSKIPESVRALGARVCSWKRGQLGSGLCARGLSPSLRQLPFSLASPTLACFPPKRKNC